MVVGGSSGTILVVSKVLVQCAGEHSKGGDLLIISTGILGLGIILDTHNI